MIFVDNNNNPKGNCTNGKDLSFNFDHLIGDLMHQDHFVMLQVVIQDNIARKPFGFSTSAVWHVTAEGPKQPRCWQPSTFLACAIWQRALRQLYCTFCPVSDVRESGTAGKQQLRNNREAKKEPPVA